ncbi:hypothetical protein SEA_WEST99_14 [Mycobacterium phage West99]|uniref:DUF7196 domain-containing protein n=14 Tax=Rosebushvirus TaxID=1982900 RepID=A0A0M4RBB5_9CAUD|nr:gp14 [Mycobacterium phage Rosebush]AEN79517.1 hypothetical protein ARBITER_14 [Mycobacterium phage Arbiter]AER48636.1 hypothetical protein ARES_14 [Mycobacterium phage Ares]ALF01299.1 hypothetical protein SEA_TRES_14 [Mycobacterium phage Tres]AUX82224.1 hypothetical protein SEA_ITSYBITSY1_14 [Mycobacterium phage ItsyBitsy1]AVO21861.1 hypothetical protein SEA_KHETH_14 [Mycobacterium phage Kheth]AVR76509.1 hypothetical protein SEA_BOYLE_14 [Mycobacterium phage Boyle]AZF93656.1 hypothetical 
MACGCRKKSAASPSSSITGFRYVPPDGGDPVTYMTIIEARAAQRANGGGTIKTLRSA